MSVNYRKTRFMGVLKTSGYWAHRSKSSTGSHSVKLRLESSSNFSC